MKSRVDFIESQCKSHGSSRRYDLINVASTYTQEGPKEENMLISQTPHKYIHTLMARSHKGVGVFTLGINSHAHALP